MDEEYIVVVDTPVMQKRVYKSPFKGKEYIHIREFYKKDDGGFGPTKKGITFTPDQLEALVAAIETQK